MGTPLDLPWLVALGACLGVLLGSRTVRRVLLAGLVIARYVALGIAARLAGRKDVTPSLVRRAFEDLGPTYIKLGQIVASSQGLFPRRYVAEFRHCLDRVRPFPFADAVRILRADLGRPIEEVFASLDPAPLASASIAQVHAARLRDGRDVVVKIQRPNIQDRVDADVRILHLAARVFALVPRVELANPVAIVNDFDATIHEELDFVREAENMVEFNRIMGALGHGDIVAPTVIPEYTTRRMLVMERFYGVRVDDVAAVRARTSDAEGTLVHGMHAWFQCMILYGFFHGDVHAGNLLVLDDGRLGFLDFGIIGRFTPLQRRQVTDYIISFATGDYRRLAAVMAEMGSVGAQVDLDELAVDLKAVYAPWLSLSFGELKYGELLPSVMRVSVKHGMHLPKEFILVTKQMLFFDRYAKLLAPRLNVFSDPRLVAGIGADVARARAMWS
ncbi:MAG: AarF/ABC1/UbiB kinase family protein [Myxococcales bacterium]|nr:AarF/ABC1/UbiB kinase family protein [Myxococcales bacterium]